MEPTAMDRLRLFTRTILKNPGFSGLVENYYFSGDVLKTWGNYAVDSALSKRILYSERIRHLGLQPVHQWEYAMDKESVGGYFAFVLVLLPRIRNLHLRWRNAIPQDLLTLGTLLAPGILSPTPPGVRSLIVLEHQPYLSNLRRMHLNLLADDLYDYTAAMSLDELLKFFYSPRIEYASVCLPPAVRNFSFPSSGPRLEHLTELHLPHARTTPSFLANLLGSAPPLKVLEYFYTIPDDEEEQSVDVVSLNRAIASVSQTLVALKLHASMANDDLDEQDQSYPRGPFQGCLEGLERCQHLQVISVDMMMLAELQQSNGHPEKIQTQFPEGLEELRLGGGLFGVRDNDFGAKDLLRGVELWLEEKQKGRLPAWEVLKINCIGIDAMWKEEVLEDSPWRMCQPFCVDVSVELM